MNQDEHPHLEIRSVSKSFPGVKALRSVSLTLNRCEVLAVIGENGAGKSTLMKILAGVQQPDTGDILIEGKKVAFNHVQSSMDAGISLIHQELNMADNLDVGANIFLGREPLCMGLIDKEKIYSESLKFLEMVGLEVSPDLLVNRLTIGRQQLVEIAKALSIHARILIMDEPTSSLSAHETANLFKVVKDLKRRGVSIIYISHRLSEVKELADRVIVLRDGANAGELGSDEINHDRMVQMMVGRDVSRYYQRKAHSPGEEVMSVQDLTTPVYPRHKIQFSIRKGEIVGLAGLVGAGRTELLLTLFGITPPLNGQIQINGRPVVIRNSREAIASGMALVPEDRKQAGLILEMGVRHNLSLASLARDQKAGFLNHAAEEAIAKEMIQAMRIKTPSDAQIVQYLSGGNQQKVVLGKWLAMKPAILLLDEPTRGIDVGAKEEIYGLMHDLAGKGVSILFVSSEMEEILSLSDRVMVLHEGRMTGELSKDKLSEEAVMRLATGHVPNQMEYSITQ